jgi:leucyl aminopeptidase
VADHPTFEVSSAPAHEVKADLLVVPVFEGPVAGPGVLELSQASGTDLVGILRESGFRGKAGDRLLVPGGAIRARNTLLLGVGPRSDAGVAAVREAGMRAGAASAAYTTVASTIPQLGPSVEDSARAFTEGFLLGAYRFERYKRGGGEPSKVEVVRELVPASARGAIRRGTILGAAARWTRDLVNTPAADATPELLADIARETASELGVGCKVWKRADLERGGFGGILAVGMGSSNSPCMVELTSTHGPPDAKPIAITGKGITFDSGGLVLKHSDMDWMKSDMAGAATALATVRAVAELELPLNLIAILPFAENMPGASAIRPGDVVHHRGGHTSEVLDTDGEGRVLLADALAYLCEKEPALILDSATLTDASGLGPDLWAVMGTDQSAMAQLLDAGAEAGDRGWEIPLWSPYRKLIDSDVADVKNVGDHGFDTAMMAALFLRDFVDDGVAWLHLDIGSSAWAEHETDLRPEGATGSPTPAFIRFMERRVDGSAG